MSKRIDPVDRILEHYESADVVGLAVLHRLCGRILSARQEALAPISAAEAKAARPKRRGRKPKSVPPASSMSDDALGVVSPGRRRGRKPKAAQAPETQGA